MTAALRFFVLIEVLGLAATPLAAVVFARLPGRGLAFAKPLGLLLVTWVVWVLGSIGVGQSTLLWIIVVVLLAAGGAVVVWRVRPEIPRGALLWSEGLALGAFALMALLVAYSPDVWQTEKPMDMAFVNASGNATHFPPEDPWMAGEDLNYYYLGHLMASGVIRLSAVAPDVGYNLSVAAFFAFSVVAAFGLAYSIGGRVVIGLWGIALCVLAGTIGSGLELVEHGGPLRQYDWFAASRVIKGTINEFPAFSFTLADLHGHLMAIPFSLLALAFGLQVAVAGPAPPPARFPAVLELVCAAIAVGTLYAINAWSFPVIAGLVALCAVVRARDAPSVRERARTLTWMTVLLLLSGFAVLPFLLTYDAAADGLGSVSKRAGFASWAADNGAIYGLLAYLVLGAFLVALIRSRHPWRTGGWMLAVALFAGSLLAPADLTAVALLTALVWIAAYSAFLARAPSAERFTWILIGGGLLCLLIPEVVYVRDSFAGTSLYRMNTVFKLGYNAWLLLAIAGAPAIVWTWGWMRRRARVAQLAWGIPLLALLALAAVFPVAGTYARKGGFANAPHLDGLHWLSTSAPGDPGAIEWLRDHAARGSVVLEAVGDDYSAFGHARISTFTGLPTVMGWTGHELQWAHDPGRRRQEVERMYTGSEADARPLLDQYGVRYVVVGPIERTTYGDEGVAKWDTLGRRVYDQDGTTVWKLR